MKNINKFRPIVDASRHPLKSVLNVAARALMFVMRSVQYMHYKMFCTQELCTFIDRVDKQLIAKSVDSTELSLEGSDIKDMLTALPHGKILDATAFTLDLCAKQHPRRKVLVVKRSGQRGGRFGIKAGEGEIVINVRDLLQLAKFELDHACFTVGQSHVLRQFLGIVVMGGMMSPIMAMYVAAGFEHKWSSGLGADEKYFVAIRYMDDVFRVVFAACDSMKQKLATNRFLRDCFKAPLKVKLTGVGNGVDMLAARVHVLPSSGKEHRLACLHENKVLKHIRKHGDVKLQQFIPWSSQHSRQQLVAMLWGLLHRIYADTSRHAVMKLLPAVQCYVLESWRNGYPNHLFLSCLHAFVCAKVPKACRGNWLFLYQKVMQKRSGMHDAWLSLGPRFRIAEWLEQHVVTSE